MTIKEDVIILWDNGVDKFWLFSVPYAEQYKYIEGKPCITFGIAYENLSFRGQDIITIFDHYLTETVKKMKDVYENLEGEFRLYDIGADTDSYIDFKMLSLGKLSISGRLGSTYSSNSLTFEFKADQTLLKALIRYLTQNMREINEQAIKEYFQIVEDYCKRIVDFMNANYDANISDIPSLYHFQSMNGIWRVTINDTDYCFHGNGCSASKNSKEICGWDFSGDGYWCVIVDIYKVASTLKHVQGYEEVEAEDVRTLCDRLVQEGVLEKTGVTTYRVKDNNKRAYCSKMR